MSQKLKIGISACLLGKKVRYDGGSFQPALINEVFPAYFDFVSFCPEVEIGMSIPRETIRLIKTEDSVRLIAPKSGIDHTASMESYAKEKVQAMENMGCSGFILKKDSPSCGMERVKIYEAHQRSRRNGVGLFARQLQETFPLIPVEDDGRLNDIRLREHWIERVFAVHRLNRFIEEQPNLGQLMEFHASSKMQLMVHHPQKYRLLGKKLASVEKHELPEFYPQYKTAFMDIMKTKPSIVKHVDVIYHLMGFFKKNISPGDKEELIQVIEQFRKGQVPLVVPLTLLNHHLKNFPTPWMVNQTYLNPFPGELMLRSHL